MTGAKAASLASKHTHWRFYHAPALNSCAYPRTIQHYAAQAEVFSYAAPLLVPLTEEGWLSGELTASIVQHYLDLVLAQSVDCLLLGCTHYPIGPVNS